MDSKPTNINIKMLVRNLQLEMLGIGKLSSMERELFNFLNENLNNLNTYTSDKEKDCLFFGKSPHDIILKYYSKDNSLCVNYYKSYNLREYENNVEITTWWCGYALNLNINSISYVYSPFLVDNLILHKKI